MNAPLRPASVEPVAELFAEHGNLVFRTLQYLGVPSASVDDALQDVFITAHRRWDSFDGSGKARTWLYGIARRVAWRYRRNHAHRGARFVLTEHPVEGEDAPFERAHARRSVQALIEGLDEPKRAAFVLVEVEGFTAAEAAQLLEVPLGTVYSRVRAAWARLRDAARDDVQLTTMRVEMEPKRRRTVQRAMLAACVPGAATAVAASSIVPWLLGGALAASVVVGAVVSRDEPATRPPRGETPASTEPQPAATAASATPVAAAPTPEPSRPSPAPVVAAPLPAKPSRPKPSPEPPTAPNTLAAEAKLIRTAKELARDGKPDEAKAVLDEHARKYPAGQLKDEREQVRRGLQ